MRYGFPLTGDSLRSQRACVTEGQGVTIWAWPFFNSKPMYRPHCPTEVFETTLTSPLYTTMDLQMDRDCPIGVWPRFDRGFSLFVEGSYEWGLLWKYL